MTWHETLVLRICDSSVRMEHLFHFPCQHEHNLMPCYLDINGWQVWCCTAVYHCGHDNNSLAQMRVNESVDCLEANLRKYLTLPDPCKVHALYLRWRGNCTADGRQTSSTKELMKSSNNLLDVHNAANIQAGSTEATIQMGKNVIGIVLCFSRKDKWILNLICLAVVLKKSSTRAHQKIRANLPH